MSINSVSGSSMSGLQGYGGLASGLDRDSLIEGMTYATQSKIYAQQQKKDLQLWEQQAIQELTTKMYEFSNTYFSFTSDKNLLGDSLFARNDLSVLGVNSKYINVSGVGNGSEMPEILGVKTMARDAQMVTSGKASDQALTFDGIADLGEKVDINMLAGQSLYFEYGGEQLTVQLQTTDGFDYSTPESTIDAINKAMAEVDLPKIDGTLADAVEASLDENGRVVFTNTGHSSNEINLTGGSGASMFHLGFLDLGETMADLSDDEKRISAAGTTGKISFRGIEETTVYNALSEEKLSFTYNGKSGSIELDKYDSSTTMEDIQADIQGKIDKEFGAGRIRVNLDDTAEGQALSFETTKFVYDYTDPDNVVKTQVADESSTLSFYSGSYALVGDQGIFGIQQGESNRINMNTTIGEAGFGHNPVIDQTAAMTIKNGSGEEIDLTELGVTWNSSVDEIVDAINEAEDLGIKIEYQSNSDKFVVTATQQGTSGEIDLSGTVADALFGADIAANNTITNGQDATILVRYPGSEETLELTRDSNTFDMDGMNVTLKGTFGYDEAGVYQADTEAVTFTAEVDTEKAAEAVKEMIDDYNEMLAEINSMVSEKPNRDYAPLTEEERADLSESQIELWEEEAKKGLLFNDSDIKGLADALRFTVAPAMAETFKDMGITVSTNYEDNGKLVFDQTKFEAALAADPEAVATAMNESATADSAGGLITGMKATMDRYASMTGSTKGILVERAGSPFAPTSVLDNSIQTQIDDMDETLERLKNTLEMEQDRYVAQFTQLETLISQMNSQSSYLSSMFSY